MESKHYDIRDYVNICLYPEKRYDPSKDIFLNIKHSIIAKTKTYMIEERKYYPFTWDVLFSVMPNRGCWILPEEE